MIEAETVARFRADGAVVLRGVFAPWVERLREGVAALMADPSPLERSYQPEGSARFFQDLCNWQRIGTFEAFVRESPAGEIAAALMGSATARFFHDHVLVKEPGTSLVTPWHQDLPYYCVGGNLNVSFWIPLDPVPRATTLECVAGSQAWGVSHKPQRFDGTDLYPDDRREKVPDVEADRAAWRILGWELAPGDAVAFAFATLHGAPGNPAGGSRRRVFSARFVGDDAVFVDRQGRGSPPFRQLTLADGAKLEGPEFPLVFPAGAARELPVE